MLSVLVVSITGQAFGSVPHFDLVVTIQPDKSYVSVQGEVELPTEQNDVKFLLNENLDISLQGAKLSKKTNYPDSKLRTYQVTGLSENKKVHFKYQGFLKNKSQFSRSAMPSMVFDLDYLFLDGNSAWYPILEGFSNFTFELEINLPAQWEIISQGKREKLSNTLRYSEFSPQDNLYLIGGPFERYSRNFDLNGKIIELEVYLLEKAPRLAEKYLALTGQFISEYSRMIGEYPYDKFAVVENRYQTGYGMPSFTLLGSRVIRLPFILYTSLPHEVLHNWWGNGVYVDYDQGNWSEGLTAYMADHLFSEKKDKDPEYRRKALEKYANFAAEHRDFPLSDFTSRHNQASQAVGYSKSLMIFHMLRRQLGDELFYQNIQTFWQDYQFKQASFEKLIQTLSKGSNIDWRRFHNHWINRKGAPQISLDKTEVTKTASGYQLDLTISQIQPVEAYPILVPIRITFENSIKQKTYRVQMKDKQLQVQLDVENKPHTVNIDPDYDVFRLLSQQERPASLSRMFGAEQQVLIYPHMADEKQRKAWQSLALSWQKLYGNVKLLSDEMIDTIPQDTAVWILGWENALLKKYNRRFNTNFQQLNDNQEVAFNQKIFKRYQHAVVLMDADTSRTPLGFIGADQVTAITGLARKLPHYNSYGALTFHEKSVENDLKLALPVLNSPLSKVLVH